MTVLDRRLDLLGRRAHVVVEGAGWRRARELLAALPTAGPGRPDSTLRVAPGADASTSILTDATGLVLCEGSTGPVLGRLVSELTAAAVGAFDGLAVHAGVVARDGRAVVLPAVSGTGKSTLTAACLLAGFDYVSDEALCLPHGTTQALPFPKPLALTGDSATLLGLARRRWDTKDLVAVGAMGAGVAVGPVQVAHVVLLRRTGRRRPHLEQAPAADAVAQLLAMGFNAYRDPGRAISTAAGVVAGARSWVLDVGDPHEAAAALYALVDPADGTRRSAVGTDPHAAISPR